MVCELPCHWFCHNVLEEHLEDVDYNGVGLCADVYLISDLLGGEPSSTSSNNVLPVPPSSSEELL